MAIRTASTIEQKVGEGAEKSLAPVNGEHFGLEYDDESEELILTLKLAHPDVAASRSEKKNPGVNFACHGKAALAVPGFGTVSVRGWWGLNRSEKVGVIQRTADGALAAPPKATGRKLKKS